ncbi:hypothetical protein FRC03_004558 [Tulasnella sp. 419]|nr:hypothetical protein FRC02_008288 [Tulasnella sp. 418]KAG8962143.1 hypothetical protein FRC03_004558 [Tulasnella sp. 419]
MSSPSQPRSAELSNDDTLPSPASRDTPTRRTTTIRRSRWRTKRFVLLTVFIVLWLYIAYKLIVSDGAKAFRKQKKPKVIHADRYSKKYKFRPAASPVITETMKDGTIRLRGAFRDPRQEHDEL